MTASIQVSASEAPAEKPVEQAPAQGQSTPAQAQTAERPAWLPEKFATPEDLAKSYAELEKKVGQSQSAPAPANEQQVQATLQANGLDMAAFNAEFNKNGKLSEESYAKLAAAGLNRAFVDDFIRGQEAIAQQEINAVFAAVGGEAEFKKVQTWARANLSPQELADFNKVVDEAPVSVLTTVIQGLQARYARANGREPKLLNGTPGTNAAPFRSRAEIISAMSDPRYRKDEAYRADVTARLAISNL